MGGRLRVWLHAPIRAFLIAIGAYFALVLTPLEFHMFCGFILNGKVPAVKLAYQVLKGHVDAACVPMKLGTVKLIVKGDKAHPIERENLLIDMDKTTKLCGAADNN